MCDDQFGSTSADEFKSILNAHLYVERDLYIFVSIFSTFYLSYCATFA